ncbi:MAG TPA: ester cyclase [Blastocatellia bacterium]|nr:ester cyclase [Blastocatellia bacterium]
MISAEEKLAGLRRFAEEYTAAWCSQNAARVGAFYEQNGSLSVNGSEAAGREAIKSVAQGFMTAFPNLKVSFDDLLIEDDRVTYHWTLTGTNTGPGGTGRDVRISGFEVWQMGANGLIASSQGSFDGADYNRQLGL